MTTVYLSIEQVLAIHRIQTTRFGRTGGVRDARALDAAVARAQSTFGGEDLYPDVVAKASSTLPAR